MYLNHCASSNARKLTLSYGSILNANLGQKLGQSDVSLGYELGQSDIELGQEFGWLNVELGQSDVNSNLTDEPPTEPLDEPPGNLNEPSVEPSPDGPPDKPIDEPPRITLRFCFDLISNVADFSFCLDTNIYPTINLDNLGSGDTCENLVTNPDNNLYITAPFKLNAGPDAELDVGDTVTGNDDERGTGSIDLEVDENLDTVPYNNPSINNAIDFTTNYCAVTRLGNDYSQASITGHTQTIFSWNQVNLWYLTILYTIYCLTQRPSADDYTASSYFNLLPVTSQSRSWLVILS